VAKLNRRFKESFSLPVIYWFQLLGLAQGLAPEEMGFNRHKIKVDPVLEKLQLAV